MATLEDRELLMQTLVSKTVSEIHRFIWSDQLTDAEARLVLMRVIERLISSVTIERQVDVMREVLTSRHRPLEALSGTPDASSGSNAS